jgi:hypothetical protein
MHRCRETLRFALASLTKLTLLALRVLTLLSLKGANLGFGH